MQTCSIYNIPSMDNGSQMVALYYTNYFQRWLFFSFQRRFFAPSLTRGCRTHLICRDTSTTAPRNCHRNHFNFQGRFVRWITPQKLNRFLGVVADISLQKKGQKQRTLPCASIYHTYNCSSKNVLSWSHFWPLRSFGARAMGPLKASSWEFLLLF